MAVTLLLLALFVPFMSNIWEVETGILAMRSPPQLGTVGPNNKIDNSFTTGGSAATAPKLFASSSSLSFRGAAAAKSNADGLPNGKKRSPAMRAGYSNSHPNDPVHSTNIDDVHIVKSDGAATLLNKHVVEVFGKWMSENGLTSQESQEQFVEEFILDMGLGKSGLAIIPEAELKLEEKFADYCTTKRAGYLLYRKTIIDKQLDYSDQRELFDLILSWLREKKGYENPGFETVFFEDFKEALDHGVTQLLASNKVTLLVQTCLVKLGCQSWHWLDREATLVQRTIEALKAKHLFEHYAEKGSTDDAAFWEVFTPLHGHVADEITRHEKESAEAFDFMAKHGLKSEEQRRKFRACYIELYIDGNSAAEHEEESMEQRLKTTLKKYRQETSLFRGILRWLRFL